MIKTLLYVLAVSFVAFIAVGVLQVFVEDDPAPRHPAHSAPAAPPSNAFPTFKVQ